MEATTKTLELTAVAHRLGVAYPIAHRMCLTRELDAEKRGGRWAVSVASVEAVERSRANSRFAVAV